MGNICSGYHTSPGKATEERSISVDSSKYLQLKHFDYLATLGEGAFGKVVLVRRKQTGLLYATKLICTDRLRDIRARESEKMCKQRLIEFRNPFIINLHHVFESSGKLCFVLDFMQGGNIGFHIHKHKRFKPSIAIFYAAEVLIALELFHQRGFAYCDLKPENVLLDTSGHAKLADFNMRTTIEELRASAGASLDYTSPERISEDFQGIEADFWAFGVLIYHMLSGETPFQDGTCEGTCSKILREKCEFGQEFSQDAEDLIKRLLQKNPRERMVCCEEVRKHGFFGRVNWEEMERREGKPPIQIRVKDNVELKYFPKTVYPPMVFSGTDNGDANGSMMSEVSRISDYSFSR
jgi:serine/threonine protein kinase